MQQCCYSAPESGGAESGAELNRPGVFFKPIHSDTALDDAPIELSSFEGGNGKNSLALRFQVTATAHCPTSTPAHTIK